jgi:hypothetical protein
VTSRRATLNNSVSTFISRAKISSSVISGLPSKQTRRFDEDRSGRLPAALNRSNKALRATTIDALVNAMNESRLILFKLGAGKPHPGRAFQALRALYASRDLVLWYFLPHGCSDDFAREGFTIRKVAATNQNVPFAC